MIKTSRPIAIGTRILAILPNSDFTDLTVIVYTGQVKIQVRVRKRERREE
jgi:hypothetical protein